MNHKLTGTHLNAYFRLSCSFPLTLIVVFLCHCRGRFKPAAYDHGGYEFRKHNVNNIVTGPFEA